MLKEESNETAATSNWSRVCNTCRAAPCTVFCRADSAYLCSSCDTAIHTANTVASRHERVRVCEACEACEQAPAAFLCKADAASLCVACDADIHSANPLARRHQRATILPMSDCLYAAQITDPSGIVVGSALAAKAEDGFLSQEGDETTVDEEDEDEAASWLLLNPVKNTTTTTTSSNNNNNQNNGFFFGVEVDDYLDLVEYNSSCGDQKQFTTDNHHHHHQQVQQQEHYGGPHKSYGGDGIVPVQMRKQSFHQLGLEYKSSKAAYSYNGALTHNVAVSSMDVGIVPESTMSEISISKTPKGAIDLFNGANATQMPAQLSPMDREARVLRYREKKKTRKFEKTIRYVSRKAYAETRPRIKGRFAKRNEVLDHDQIMFSTSLIAEDGYGVVPLF